MEDLQAAAVAEQHVALLLLLLPLQLLQHLLLCLQLLHLAAAAMPNFAEQHVAMLLLLLPLQLLQHLLQLLHLLVQLLHLPLQLLMLPLQLV